MGTARPISKTPEIDSVRQKFLILGEIDVAKPNAIRFVPVGGVRESGQGADGSALTY